MWDQIQADANLISGARAVLTRLHDAGFQAYLVGGCVRDALLSKPIHDVDIATSALPAEVTSIFERTIPTGMQHGTVTVMVDQYPFEVTTFRQESGYEHFRRPKEVSFIHDLEGDLLRRDFTFNAMAMDIDGHLIDPYDGQNDLDKGIVRCVGDADARFQEDALRMIRCVRFAACYDFQVDPSTWAALRIHRTKLQYIAMERVRAEMDKMIDLSLYSAIRGMSLMQESRLLEFTKVMIHDQWNLEDHTLYQVVEQEQDRLEHWDKHADVAVRWGLLFYRSHTNPEQAQSIMQKLTFPNRKNTEIVELLQLHAYLHSIVIGNKEEDVKPSWVRGVLTFGKDAALRWLHMMEGDELFQSPHQQQASPIFTQLRKHGERWLSELHVLKISDLDIKGHDILKHQKKKAGPWLGELLQHLLYQVAMGQVDNDRHELLEEASQVINNE
ncbi:CCA tRNA nucleotidyltransferase [Paenibacillus selenitireducens]|uniref:CCA tRNA nucleotidyltransferase n=1 Tax=Paenibacillus selenitireducens TaxID=1324314 RepID=A0A1T2XP70_9BACL|nr:CCA tRNA nucleotidyltransferase [Paenibacillus selenitireducens]OPA81473.1 CCA tRNA nucleotidyltransferase [Paenibacillus selenitireducens]